MLLEDLGIIFKGVFFVSMCRFHFKVTKGVVINENFWRKRL